MMVIVTHISRYNDCDFSNQQYQPNLLRFKKHPSTEVLKHVLNRQLKSGMNQLWLHATASPGGKGGRPT